MQPSKEHCDVAINPGMKLGPYEVLAPLGAGAMGWVYRARDTRLDRLVAIKVLVASQSADERRLDRLQREARAISRVSHPNICAIHDVGQSDGVTFLVMDTSRVKLSRGHSNEARWRSAAHLPSVPRSPMRSMQHIAAA